MAKQPRDAVAAQGAALTAEQERQGLLLTRQLVVRLLGRLDHAFNESPETPVTVKTERERLVAAIWSIAAFIGKAGFDLPFAHRFFELGSAIEDLNLGIRTDLLTPAAQGSRRTPDPAELWRGRACVALALEALMKAGRTREAAAKEILSRSPGVQKLISKKRSAAGNATKAFIEWRKKLPSVKNWQVTEFYSRGNDRIAALAISDDATARLVDLANDLAARAAQLAQLAPLRSKASRVSRKKPARRPQRDAKGQYKD